MLRLAWKAIKHSPKRLILTSVSVLLGVSLVVTIHTFTNTIGRQFNDMIDEIYSGADISVAQPGSFNFSMVPGNPFPASIVDDVRAIPGVAEADGGLSATPTILTPSGELPPTTGGAPNIFFNWDPNADLSRMTVVEGRAVASPGEATIDQLGMNRLGYSIGDTLHVATDTGIVDYTIVGATWFGTTDDLSGAVLVQLTLPDMETLAGLPGQFESISVMVEDGYTTDDVVASINRILPSSLVAISNAQIIADQQASIREGMKYVDIFALVFALIAVFVGAFIIANTFRIIVNQREREIGLVRALGAQGSQVRKQILIEALIVAVLSSILGIAVGYGFAVFLAAVITSGSGMNLGIPTLPLDAILWGLGVGLAVTLVSAILPAIHASRISPMEALRESATSSRRPLKVRNIVGASLTVGAIVVIEVALNADVVQPGIWVGAAAAVLVIGVALLSAQFLSWLSRGMRRALGRLFGFNGRLAVGNVQREPRRAGITATALMIGVLLLSMVATLTETFKVTARSQVEGSVISDLIVGGNMMSGSVVDVPPLAQDAVAATPGVTETSLIEIGQATIDSGIPATEGSTVSIEAIDPTTADATYVYPTTPDPSKVGNGIYISPRIQNMGYGVGDMITLKGVDGTLTLHVTGLYTREGDADIFMSLDTAAKLDDSMLGFMLLVNLDPNVDTATAQAAVEASLTEFPLLQVTQPEQMVKSINDLFDTVLLIITIMLSASLVIAILGVANTLFLSVTERTREIGLLRAVGVRRSSIWKMITLESVIIALFGALMGIVLGVGLGVALLTALSSFGFSAPVVPWTWLGVYAVLAVLAGIVAALVPAWLASRLNILEAVTTE